MKLGVVGLPNVGKSTLFNAITKAGAEAAAVKVEAVVNAQGKFPKVDVFHYKPKKQIRKRQGHRQPYTELKITAIKG